ncbi:hypothetical protein Desaci_2018 [Desulfosporosinus acidiphilus SJ4]|uniref:Phage minor structural protein GP20 n=1 Tax=Desulfosporosinus acidiphilus (strain DSM 22704 / JCM 16185 / SJ4) TaxID=646529 RepID=I4D5B9_DESAJ|nr:hypothetical protein [Desulfosporosinus acidiphilus]AFM40993.1 hypothetical protein Desaci_2018 [Desulfosporosinus acidiphilus SJ4]
MEFTPEQQAHIDGLLTEHKEKWETEILAPLQTELAGLKPVAKTDKEKEIEAKEQELWNKEKSLHIKEKGLSDFAEFFNANTIEDLDIQAEKLNKILEAKKLNNAYVPSGHKTADAYAQAEKSGDTQTMIGSKLSKLFS